MFKEKVNSFYPYFTASEARISEYIIANHKVVAKMTSQELADELCISQSTIIRFSQKLGYSSYKNMLLDVERFDARKELDYEINLNDSTYTTISKITTHVKNMIDLINELNSPLVFDETVELLKSAGTIYCFGFLSTNSIADNFNQFLQLYGLNSYCLDMYTTMSSMRNRKDSVLVVFSKSGETAWTTKVAQFARENGIKVIGITNSMSNSLSIHLDIYIKIPHSNIRTRLENYSENVGLMFIIECIALTLYKSDFARFSDQISEHTNLIKDVKYTNKKIKSK
ncbi:MAG: MurR/RpiR family transcriptional regulator [Erysipelotrichaceae bacterium]